MAGNSKDFLQEAVPLVITGLALVVGWPIISSLVGAATNGAARLAGTPAPAAQPQQAGLVAGAGQPNAATCAGWTRQLSAAELAATGMAPGHTVADLFNAQFGANGFNHWRAQGGQC